jgi:probable rRNA maturation factor
MTIQTPVQVFGADEQVAVPIDVMRWVQLAQLVLREERVAAEMELSVIFVDEATIIDLNERYLDGIGPTDVLAFPLDEAPPPGGRPPDPGGPGAPEDPDIPLVLGDVVVCPAVARAQAEAGARDFDDEIALLVVHGVLHLLGYDHAEPEDEVAMQRREAEILSRWPERAATTEPELQPGAEQ